MSFSPVCATPYALAKHARALTRTTSRQSILWRRKPFLGAPSLSIQTRRGAARREPPDRLEMLILKRFLACIQLLCVCRLGEWERSHFPSGIVWDTGRGLSEPSVLAAAPPSSREDRGAAARRVSAAREDAPPSHLAPPPRSTCGQGWCSRHRERGLAHRAPCPRSSSLSSLQSVERAS